MWAASAERRQLREKPIWPTEGRAPAAPGVVARLSVRTHIARHRAPRQGPRECGQSDSIKPGKTLKWVHAGPFRCAGEIPLASATKLHLHARSNANAPDREAGGVSGKLATLKRARSFSLQYSQNSACYRRLPIRSAQYRPRLRSCSFQLGTDDSERVVQLGADRGHGGDNHHRDQRGNEAILDGGRAILTFPKIANANIRIISSSSSKVRLISDT